MGNFTRFLLDIVFSGHKIKYFLGMLEFGYSKGYRKRMLATVCRSKGDPSTRQGPQGADIQYYLY